MARDYRNIRRWAQERSSIGTIFGLYEFIDKQIERARFENAPEDALFRRDDGTWAVPEDLTDDKQRQEFGLLPLTRLQRVVLLREQANEMRKQAAELQARADRLITEADELEAISG